MTEGFDIDEPSLRTPARSLAREFHTLAIKLDEHAANTNIVRTARIVWAVFFAVAVLLLIGTAPIPFRVGASVVVAVVVGGLVGVARGRTAGGAKIALKIIEENTTEDATAIWSTFSAGVRNALEREPENLQRLEEALEPQLDWEWLQRTDGSVLLLSASGLGLVEIMAKSIELHRQQRLQPGDILRRMAEILSEFAQTSKLE